MIDEILQNLFAPRRVRDFGMKLQSVKFALPIFDCGEIGTFRPAGGEKTLRQSRHFIAVTVPDIELITEPIEQLRAVCDLQHSCAVLAPSGEHDLAAEMMRHLHQSVTNSEHRNA